MGNDVLYKKENDLVEVIVFNGGFSLNGANIGHSLFVRDKIMGIEGELLFGENGAAIGAKHLGRDNTGGDVSLLQWIDCYNGRAREIMDGEAQEKYFPISLKVGHFPGQSAIFLSPIREPIGQEEDISQRSASYL